MNTFNPGVICCPCWRFCRLSVHSKSLSQSKSKGYEEILFCVEQKINVCTCLCFAKGDEWVKVNGDSSSEMLYEGHVWTMVGSLLSRTCLCAGRTFSQENSLLSEYRARTYKIKDLSVSCFLHKQYNISIWTRKSHVLVRLTAVFVLAVVLCGCMVLSVKIYASVKDEFLFRKLDETPIIIIVVISKSTSNCPIRLL